MFKFSNRTWKKSVPSAVAGGSISKFCLHVICELQVTNTSSTTREFAFSHDDYRLRRHGKEDTKAITSHGRQYGLSGSLIGSKDAGSSSLYNRAVLAPNVPVRIVLTLKNVPGSSTKLARLKLAIYLEGPNDPSLIEYTVFRNIPIQK